MTTKVKEFLTQYTNIVQGSHSGLPYKRFRIFR
jgi:hypothetical protein